MSRKLRNAILSSGALIAGCLAATPSLAASHREAPMISTGPDGRQYRYVCVCQLRPAKPEP